jgi:chemotaxis protein CheD
MIILGHKDGSIENVNECQITQTVKGYPTHTVIGGEFAVAYDASNIAFKTLLGSCVALMFYDKNIKIKGMNHFLLPTTSDKNENMKYGLYSVEAMLNEMYKLGCKKENMAVKISGGADIMFVDASLKSIGFRNVEFAKDFCSSEGFRILSNHTRGTLGRIILLTTSFETFIKNIKNPNTTNKVAQKEKALQNELSIRQPATAEYIAGTGIFDLDEKASEEKMDIELF